MTEEAAGATSLRRNSLNFTEVIAQSVATISPTGAISLLPLLVFVGAGNGTWVSFLIAMVLVACIGYCCAQFSRNTNSAGSFYVWVARGLGPGAGHTAGWALQLGYVITGVAATVSFGIFGADFLSRITGGALAADNRWLLIALFVFDCAAAIAVAVIDIRLSVRTGLVLEVISVGLIVVLCLAIWIHAGGVLDSNQLLLRGATGGGVLVGVVLSIAAFTGFESAGTLGMEARNPYRTIGRAILYTCIGIGIFNLIVAYTQVLGFEGTESGFAKSEAPLPDLAEIVGLSFLAPVMDIAICSSLFAGTLALINASARIAFTMAYDGMGVSALARAHAAHHTPHVAIYVAGVSVVLISIIPVLFGVNAVELTGWVATVGTFGFMLAYALVSLASPFFLRQRGAAPPLVWAVGIVGAVSMAFIFLANWLPQIIPGGLFPALTGVVAWLPYVFLAWVAIGLAWYFVVRSRDPKLAMQIGSRFESAEAGGPVSAS